MVKGLITLFDLINQNADIARKKLEKLSLTDVTLISVNPKYPVVVEGDQGVIDVSGVLM